MEWLNYHHLLYFWTVARTGGVSAASAELRLAQPTISGQLRMLEDHFGEKLFHRVGRRLELTDVGRLVYRYADEIFTLGRELTVIDRRNYHLFQPLLYQVATAGLSPAQIATPIRRIPRSSFATRPPGIRTGGWARATP